MIFFVGPVTAGATPDVQTEQGPRPELSYLIDDTQQLDAEQALRLARGGQFKTLGLQRAHFGYREAPVWLHLRLHNASSPGKEWVVEVRHPLLGEVQAWIHSGPGEPTHYRAGLRVPLDQWPISGRNPVFPVEIGPGQTVDVLLRVHSDSSLQVPLAVHSRSEYREHRNNLYLLLGAFNGLVFSLGCYSLLIFLTLRDRNYLHYLSYVAFYLLFQLSINGLSFQYLWPSATRWAPLAVPVLGCFVLLSALGFTRSFLRLRESLPALDRAILLLMAAFLLQLAVTLAVGPRWGSALLASLSVLGTVVVLLAAGLRWRQGDADARIYLIAWTALLLGVALYSLRAISLLPNSFITEYGVQIGMIAQLLLLSIALGRRVRKAERDEQLAEQRHRRELEQRVQERTEALDLALSQLEQVHRSTDQRRRLFQTLVQAHAEVRDISDPDLLLQTLLQRLGDAHPGVGLGFIGRAPDRPKLMHYTCFHNVPAEQSNAVIEALRGTRIEGEAPMPISNWLPTCQGMLVPMRSVLRELEGFLLVTADDRPLQDDEIGDCVLLADHVGSSLEALTLRLRLERTANIDPLTGTFNRNYLNALMAKAVRDKLGYPPVDFAAIMIDLNGLKPINDRYGHSAGDALIRFAAEVLQQTCRSSDSLIRWGGDEFLLFCPGTRMTEGRPLVRRIQARNGALFEFRSDSGEVVELALNFSLGLASSSECAPGELIATADARMLADKQAFYGDGPRYR